MLSAAGIDATANGLPPLSDIESEYGVQINAVSLGDLFALYKRTGFLYREKARRVGCDDYDTKPVEFTRLTKKIDTVLAAKVSV